MTNRRKFLLGCSALTVTAGLIPETLLSASFQTRDISLDQIRFETFSAQLGSRFRVTTGTAQTTALKLVEAKRTPSTHSLAQHAEDAQNEKFSLLFRGANPLTQDTYVFEHENIGRFSMFIVPVKLGDSTYYQAVFNRVKPSTMTQSGTNHV